MIAAEDVGRDADENEGCNDASRTDDSDVNSGCDDDASITGDSGESMKFGTTPK